MKEKERLQYAVSRYSEAVKRLKEALTEAENPLSIDGTIQRFEFTFEQAWKTIQRILRFEGYDCNTPRRCLNEAYTAGIINDEAVWLDMLDDRNMTSHIYDEMHARRIYDKIKAQYANLLADLLDVFNKKLEV